MFAKKIRISEFVLQGNPSRSRISPTRYLLVALVIGIAMSAVHVPAQSRKPLTKDAILYMLKNKVTPNRMAALARERGIDFQITPTVESQLRQAGATDSLLAALRELAPPPPKPPRQVVSAPTIGTVRENPKDGLKYVWIPPGMFMMGCSPGDTECQTDEKPTHQVTITRGFWLGQTPVTVGAYKRFAGTTGRQMPGAPNFNTGWANENMPIVNVTWDDGTAYCGWMGGRLPTEAEWEYAARGGSAEARYGNLDEIAWYSNNSGNQTHDVAQKRANGLGLYDMLGNVWEWVNDGYDPKYYQNGPSQDPTGPGSGQLRVLRGGSWYLVSRLVRVSCRNRFIPSTRGNLIGFRCRGEVGSP
jgi:formylglycine-generating enzyme required for sulfatase activity